jgi:ABC-type phosphate transport system substrate-binding protein
MHTTQAKPENAREVLKFFEWAYKNGDQMAAASGRAYLGIIGHS